MLTAVIVDDETLARGKLRRLLDQVPDVTCVGEAANGADAIAVIREARPDVVFLDIDMADMSGFDVVAGLEGDPMPLIVFATAYDEFAVRAFEVHAVDYLLKPFDLPRLTAAIEHARRTFAQRPEGEILADVLEELRAQRALLERATKREYAHRLMVRSGQELVPIAVEAIDWIGAADNYVEVHAAGRTHLLRETLQSVEERLDPARFARIHRGTIVQHARVSSVRALPTGDLEVVLDDGRTLPVGRSYRARVSARWQSAPPGATREAR